MSLFQWDTSLYDEVIRIHGKHFWRHPCRNSKKVCLHRHEDMLQTIITAINGTPNCIQVILNVGIKGIHCPSYQRWCSRDPFSNIHMSVGFSSFRDGQNDNKTIVKNRTEIFS